MPDKKRATASKAVIRSSVLNSAIIGFNNRIDTKIKQIQAECRNIKLIVVFIFCYWVIFLWALSVVEMPNIYLELIIS